MALSLIQSFYRDWNVADDAGDALRKAQLSLLREHPDADWSSFRLLEP